MGERGLPIQLFDGLRRGLKFASAYLLLNFYLHHHLAEQLYTFAQKFGIFIHSFLSKVLVQFRYRRLGYN